MNRNKIYELHNTCPLCESAEIHNKYFVDGYTISKCKSCSLLFVRDIIPDEILGEIYQKSGAVDADKDIYLEDSNQDFLRYSYQQLSQKINLLCDCPEKRRLLDVGCSTGTFFEFFPDWDVYGVEISERSARIAQQKYKNVVHGNMEQAILKDNYFDCVTLQDSLDHSNNPLSVVQNAHRFLKKGGVVAIKVHNISCLFAKVSGRRFYAIIPPWHLFYFNLITLKNLLEKGGFEYKTHYYNRHKIKLSTVFLRLSRNNEKSIFAKTSQYLNNTLVGNIPIYKNLHDLITVIGVKK